MNSNRQLSDVGLVAMFAAVALTACGGGSSSSAPVPSPAAVTITGKAVDGPLQGAIACYDLNDNNACDSGEPTSAPTAADGSFSFSVDASAAGRHRVVVEVPPTAIDADTGAAVGTGFTLLAPATGSAGAQQVFASPLTTLVQAHMDATGATLTAATDLVQTQAGLSISPLADFTANGGNAQAANTARLVQLTMIQQNQALAAVVGTVDISGTPITAAELQKAITQATIAALPTVAATVTDPAISGKTGAELTAALAAAAQTIAADMTPTADQVTVAIGAEKLPVDASPPSPSEGATLTMARWTDVNNWYYRTLEASAADNTPDANGKVRYYDVHRSSESSGFDPNAGVMYGWGYGNLRSRAGDIHWNGSAWVTCSLGQRNAATVRTAAGYNEYDYCDGFEQGSSSRNAVDIGGQSIATVIAEKIRTFPGGAAGVLYANFGPADLATLGSATFASGSKLLYQSNTVTKTAVTYDPSTTANIVTVQAAAVAAGGDARLDPSIACAAATLPAATQAASLEEMVARNTGTPCIFAKSIIGADSSLDPNEWWSNSTVSLGILANGATLPVGTGNWYSTELRLRVAFATTGNGTRYYSCLSRATNGSSRNCTQIGSGSYAIETLGDARVMTFTGLPAIVQKVGFTRVFVERAGKVWFGFKNPAGATTPYVRLNLEATNSLFAALPGMPPVRPVTRYADLSADSKAALTTMIGVWGAATDTEALIFRFGPEGRFVLGQAGPANTQTREQTGSELGWFSYDAATKKFRTLLEVDSDLTAGTSHPSPLEYDTTLTVTPTSFVVANPNDPGGGATLARLTSDASGIVGMWAMSPTEFKTQQFVFFPNGRVLMIDPIGDTSGGACTTARQGPPGAEFAQYTYDAATGAVRVFGKIYDTNGCAGFFDSSAGAVAAGAANTEVNFTAVIAPGGQTATFTAPGGAPLTLSRIAIQ